MRYEGCQNEPAQFTSEDGDGSDLYACQSNDAAFARLLLNFSEMIRVTCTHVDILPDLCG
jgi:hypothetical protein